jgi:hypothetical protein
MSVIRQQNVEFKFQGIEILNAEINSPEKGLPNNAIFSFDISIEQRFNVEQGLVFVICDVSTFLLDSPSDRLGRIRSSCIFNVTELEKFIGDDRKMSLSEEFVTALNSISISTTRGIMFSTFKGTVLQGAVLPHIDQVVLASSRQKK